MVHLERLRDPTNGGGSISKREASVDELIISIVKIWRNNRWTIVF